MITEAVEVEREGVTLTIDGRIIIAIFAGKVECGEFVREVWYRLGGKLLRFNDITCNKPDCTIMRFELNATIPVGSELTKALADVQDAITMTLAVNNAAKLPHQRQVEVDLRKPALVTVE